MINQDQNSTLSYNFKLSVPDFYTIVEGLQALFKRSSHSEKIRLLTIAPISWGQNTIINVFNCTEHRERTAIELRLTDSIFAFLTSLGGNQPTNLDSIERVVNYYRSDRISCPSPNRKDVVLINRISMGKKFMQMTTLETFYLFSVENPSLKIRKSKFCELQPKNVKPTLPHDTSLCIYNENIPRLSKVNVVLFDH